MDGFSVGDKLTALSRRDTKSLGDSVERCLVYEPLVGNVAMASLYDSTSHRLLPGYRPFSRLVPRGGVGGELPKTTVSNVIIVASNFKLLVAIQNGRGEAAPDMVVERTLSANLPGSTRRLPWTCQDTLTEFAAPQPGFSQHSSYPFPSSARREAPSRP
jgi:hypothetical protein